MKYKFWSSILISIPFFAITAFVGHYSVSKKPFKLLSPIPETYATEPLVIEVINEEMGDPIIAEINKVFAKEGTKVVAKMISCAYGESKLNPLAYNFNSDGTDDVGIFQINSRWGMTVEERQDYKKNIKKAYEIYKKQGFKAWYHQNCRQ